MLGLFQAAIYLNVSDSTMSSWARRGLVKGKRLETPGGKITWEFKEKDLDAFEAKKAKELREKYL